MSLWIEISHKIWPLTFLANVCKFMWKVQYLTIYIYSTFISCSLLPLPLPRSAWVLLPFVGPPMGSQSSKILNSTQVCPQNASVKPSTDAILSLSVSGFLIDQKKLCQTHVMTSYWPGNFAFDWLRLKIMGSQSWAWVVTHDSGLTSRPLMGSQSSKIVNSTQVCPKNAWVKPSTQVHSVVLREWISNWPEKIVSDSCHDFLLTWEFRIWLTHCDIDSP